MTFLLRVMLPDRPGSLGQLAAAIGDVGGDIVSLDVVQRGPEGAVDDMIVQLPPGGLADVLITAAQSVDGVSVESLRPYLAGRDIHRDLELVDVLSAAGDGAPTALAEHAPGVFRAGWALLLEAAGPAAPVQVLAASSGAPEAEGMTVPWLPLASAAGLHRGEEWVPRTWHALGTELAAAPVGTPLRALLVGRPGGPRFLPSEIVRMAHLAGIAATVAAVGQPG